MANMHMILMIIGLTRTPHSKHKTIRHLESVLIRQNILRGYQGVQLVVDAGFRSDFLMGLWLYISYTVLAWKLVLNRMMVSRKIEELHRAIHLKIVTNCFPTFMPRSTHWFVSGIAPERQYPCESIRSLQTGQYTLSWWLGLYLYGGYPNLQTVQTTRAGLKD